MALVAPRVARVETLLLAWFQACGRDLPWRRTRDPYAILVSEVMLQQTQVDRVVPRYLAWLERWPTVESLAAATTGDVIREWQGLGYNRRAVNLHRAAQSVARDGWPADLTTLPGDRPVHGGRGALLRPRRGRASGRRERGARATSHRRDVLGALGAGAHGSRSDSLPRARSRAATCARSRQRARRAGSATSRRASRGRSKARSDSAAQQRSGSSPTSREHSRRSTTTPSARSSATALSIVLDGLVALPS